jgi:hypothetical protein
MQTSSTISLSQASLERTFGKRAEQLLDQSRTLSRYLFKGLLMGFIAEARRLGYKPTQKQKNTVKMAIKEMKISTLAQKLSGASLGLNLSSESFGPRHLNKLRRQ